MRKVIIPLNAFNNEDVKEQGQAVFIPVIAAAGADGVEIRRELLSDHDASLVSLQHMLKQHHLYTIFSAPVELWREDGTLNEEEIQEVVSEAIQLDASVLKLPLGHFQDELSDMRSLQELLETFPAHLKLLVENDQTQYGGRIQPLCTFFENASSQGIPVRMTFDVGNWKYTGEVVYEAVEKLGEYVEYIHLKHVERQNGELITLPLSVGEQEEWETILHSFSSHLPIALEFPLESSDAARMYMHCVRKERQGEVEWSV